jgi:hypothetical protein
VCINDIAIKYWRKIAIKYWKMAEALIRWIRRHGNSYESAAEIVHKIRRVAGEAFSGDTPRFLKVENVPKILNFFELIKCFKLFSSSRFN